MVGAPLTGARAGAKSGSPGRRASVNGAPTSVLDNVFSFEYNDLVRKISNVRDLPNWHCEVDLMSVRYPTGGKPPTIEIEYGLAYEFLLSLIVFNEQEGYEDEYELGNEWFDAIRARVDP